MEQEYTVRFSAVFETKVRCKPEELADAVGDAHIPEDNVTKYVSDSFEVIKVKDSLGKVVKVDEDE
jgi:hypothetical protein